MSTYDLPKRIFHEICGTSKIELVYWTMRRSSLYFTAPREVQIREENIPEPKEGEVLIRTISSLISSGTELLVYRGEIPEDMPVDANLPAFSERRFHYPLKYGYSCVGKIEAVGPHVSDELTGQTVFTFHPHESAFVAGINEINTVPEDVDLDDALFFPLMETAVNLVQDGAPRLGETAVVIGLGIVGLLTTELLANVGLSALIAIDPMETRRQLALSGGAELALDPTQVSSFELLHSYLDELGGRADVSFELSGAPTALDEAIDATADTGRIVIGSWYGNKTVRANLGGRFHRSRIQIISSQVSTIAPDLAGRWNHERRSRVAWNWLRRLSPSRYLTQRMPLGDAHKAYELLDSKRDNTIALSFTHL